MKSKRVIAATLALTMALAGAGLAACSSGAAPAKEDVNANVPAGAPPLMPETHEGRYENLGAAGCYGCHGANEQANPMLTGSVALPADHYAGGDSSSLELDPGHGLCNTCHAQS